MTERMNPAESIAAAVRSGSSAGTRLEGYGLELHEQARRLRASLDIVGKWMDAALQDDSGELFQMARNTYDKLEEELAAVAFQMEVEARVKLEVSFREPHPSPETLESVWRAAVLSDTLMEAYCIVREADEGYFEEKVRYRLMGALNAARAAADAEMKRLEAEHGLSPKA
jgi:hypothetical protein